MNEKVIPANQPIIIAANHSNSAMDALLISGLYNRDDLYWLARGDVFRKKIIAKFMIAVKTAPIFRASEVGYVDIKRNSESFKICFDLLGQNKMIGLFPEGVTVHERKLQVPFKKGLARLALQAHEALKRPIMIVPVGVSYQSLVQPRTDAFVYFGEPFSTALFFEEYLQNQNKALKDFTIYLEERLSNEIINYDSVKDQQSLNKILESQNKHLTEQLGLKFGLTNDYTFFKNDQKTVDAFINIEAINMDTESKKNELIEKTVTEVKVVGATPILTFLYKIFHSIGKAIYFVPNELSKSIIRTKIKKSAFFATVRFVLLYLLFPIYTIITALFGLFFSKLAFWAILICFPILVYLGLCAGNILAVHETN